MFRMLKSRSAPVKAVVALALTVFVGMQTLQLGSVALAAQDPAQVAGNSYQAMDAAINAGSVVRHPRAASINPFALLTPTQAHTSSSASGAYLYSYDLYRVQATREWEALHTSDYSAITVHSTFHPTSTTVHGSQATVVGDETLMIDATIQIDGRIHAFSAAKQAAMNTLRQNGRLLEAGQVNEERAIIHHTVTLRSTDNGWVIEQDTYLDPLVQALSPDHHGIASQPGKAGTLQAHAARLSGTSRLSVQNALTIGYHRDAAINYADYWWNSCNPNYTCYMWQGVDCANYVSGAVGDATGGDLLWDGTWYPDSYAFVNADGLQTYAFYNWAANAYDSGDYNTAYWLQNQYVYPGDLLFYDWGYVFGYGAPDTVVDHAAIAVAADVNGNLYADSHTTNLYHAYWDLGGGTSTHYYFINMAP